MAFKAVEHWAEIRNEVGRLSEEFSLYNVGFSR